ncbi:MAG: MATE family efflux transporter, partial [Dorea sp.]
MSSKKVMDMTKGPVLSQMTRFAIPVLLGMVFQRVYSFADAYIVGHYLGDEALAAVSISGTVMFILLAINGGVTTGVGVVISQFYGANKEEGIRHAFVASVYVAIGVALIATFGGILTTEPVLRLMQTSDELMPYAK